MQGVPIAVEAGLVGPAQNLVEAGLRLSVLGRQGGQSGQREHDLLVTAPGGENAFHQLRRGTEQSGLLGGNARGLTPQLARIVEPEGVPKRLEHFVVDVVVLQLGHLALQDRRFQGEHGIQEVVQQLGAEGEPLRRARRQCLENEAAFEEVVFVGDRPELRRLAGDRASGTDRPRPGMVGAACGRQQRRCQG